MRSTTTQAPAPRGARRTRRIASRALGLAGAGLLAFVLPELAGCGPADGARPGPASGAAPTRDHRIAEELGLSGRPLGAALEKPDFVLRDTSGEPFDFREETEGHLTLLFFGYTSCPDICPVHLSNLAAVLRKADLEVQRAVRVVFVGVDPERDTPERMREWLDRFHPEFVGLTGTPEELEAAQLAAGVPPAFVEEEEEGKDGYTVSHAGWILLYTRDGLAHLRYPFGVRQYEWAHDLAVLAEKGWPKG